MVEKKGAAKAKVAPSHPPYAKMITDAIVAEGGKNRDWSRAIAIIINSKSLARIIWIHQSQHENGYDDILSCIVIGQF